MEGTPAEEPEIILDNRPHHQLPPPASPPPTLPQQTSFTRVHVDHQEAEGIITYAIDRLGGHLHPAHHIEEDDEVVVVGAISAPSKATLQSSNPHQPRPLFYDVEGDIVMTTGSSALPQPASPSLPAQPKRQKSLCWNCEGDHILPACPQPRDGYKISANRKKFMASKGGGGGPGAGSGKRYHEENPHQRSGNIAVPGHLSQELRQVMGLQPSQLPLHIYRMRVYGYPPGWLEDAVQRSSSGLKFYGNETISMEVGTSRKEAKLKTESIISYPGFNSPPPPGTLDECREVSCPRFSEADSVESMLKKLVGESRAPTISSPDRPSPASPQPWNFNCSNSLDVPSMNRSGQYGLGRGRYVAPPDVRAPMTHPGRTELIEREARKGGRPSELLEGPSLSRIGDGGAYRAQLSRVPQEQSLELDERYLPRKRKMEGRTREGGRRERSSSPSLLRGRGGPQPTSPEIISSNPDSPVILNLPSQRKKISDSDDDETGSSADLISDGYPESKRPRVELVESDDDVMVIETVDKRSEKSSDSICILTLPEAEGSKRIPPTVRPLLRTRNNRRRQGFGDWGKNPSSSSRTGEREDVALSSGSGCTTTDEEELVGQKGRASQHSNRRRKSTGCAGEENWEDVNEFIPANPRLEAIKGILLANLEEDINSTVDESFSHLPSQDKFAAGMPEMLFEEQPPDRTRRLDAVLSVLKSRRNGLSST